MAITTTLDRSGLRIVGAVFVAFSALMASLPLRGFLAHTASDDAYYYFEIAQRFGSGAWPSYDGERITTGFHPLWEFMLVPLAGALSGHPWLFARVAVFLSAMLMLAAALVFGRTLARVAGAPAGHTALLVLAGSAGVARFGLLGMEGPLALLVLGLALDAVCRAAPRWKRFGLLAGLAILARIDMVIPIGVAFAWLALHHRRDLRPALGSGVLAGAVVAPYLAWNLALTGHMGTISAATKLFVVNDMAMQMHGGRFTLGFLGTALRALAEGAAEVGRAITGTLVAAPLALAGGDHPAALSWRQHALAAGAGVALLVAVGVWLARRSREDAEPHREDVRGRSLLLWTLGGGAAIHAVTTAWMLPGHAGAWYWGLEIVAVAVVGAALAARSPLGLRLMRGLGWSNAAASACLLLALGAAFARGRFDDRRSFGGAMAEMARAIPGVVEPGAVIGSRNGGILGFASERPIVNLDGLVNDWSFLEARQRGAMRRWIESHNVQYFADCAPIEVRLAYLREMGIRPDEVTEIYSFDGRAGAFLWRINWSPAEKSATASR